MLSIVTTSVRGMALARVATGFIDNTETLVAAMRRHVPSFTAERFTSAKELARGKHNVIRLAHVEQDASGWRTWLIDEDGFPIDEDEVQRARLAVALH